MEYRLGTVADLAHLETFVWQAVFPAFDHPDLNDEQRQANDRLVEEVRGQAVRAMGRQDERLYVAYDRERRQLGGLLIARSGELPRIELLVVARRYWGQGVAGDLLAEATFWLGNTRAILAAVRYYNERAIAFFNKQGFEDSGEVDTDFPIDRLLLIRPAQYEAPAPDQDSSDQLSLKLSQEPIAPEDPPDPAQEELHRNEPFAQRHSDERASSAGGSKYPHIEFEIEENESDDTPISPLSVEDDDEDELDLTQISGAGPAPSDTGWTKTPQVDGSYAQTGFEFDFDSAPDLAAEQSDRELIEDLEFEELQEPNEEEWQTEQSREATVTHCGACHAPLPPSARFCPQCGQQVDQPEPGRHAEPDTQETGHRKPQGDFDSPPPTNDGVDWSGSLLTDFKAFFRERFQQRVHDYFGPSAIPMYEAARQASSFQDTVATQLAALADWVRNRRDQDHWSAQSGHIRLVSATESLIEFFLVEEARKLHQGIWPQKLLRHQSTIWAQADLFSLVMDYLDFDPAMDTVYTDFVRMPKKVLQNATRRYLHAARDERVLFVYDQSLLGTGKDGFAMTDVALYWRPVLQESKARYYKDIRTVRMKGDQLEIDGQFFDAGARINRRMALLLRRLATMIYAA